MLIVLDVRLSRCIVGPQIKARPIIAQYLFPVKIEPIMFLQTAYNRASSTPGYDDYLLSQKQHRFLHVMPCSILWSNVELLNSFLSALLTVL